MSTEYKLTERVDSKLIPPEEGWHRRERKKKYMYGCLRRRSCGWSSRGNWISAAEYGLQRVPRKDFHCWKLSDKQHQIHPLFQFQFQFQYSWFLFLSFFLSFGSLCQPATTSCWRRGKQRRTDVEFQTIVGRHRRAYFHAAFTGCWIGWGGGRKEGANAAEENLEHPENPHRWRWAGEVEDAAGETSIWSIDRKRKREKREKGSNILDRTSLAAFKD